MKRKYNLRKIKSKKSYSSTDLAELLAVHVQTVRGWNKEGLTAIDPKSHRPLFLGATAKLFLKQQQEARKKHNLNHNKNCPKCNRNKIKPIVQKTLFN